MGKPMNFCNTHKKVNCDFPERTGCKILKIECPNCGELGGRNDGLQKDADSAVKLKVGAREALKLLNGRKGPAAKKLLEKLAK